MNIKTISAIAVFATASFGAVAAQAAAAPVQDTYHYGQHLDIQKVLADNADNSMTCQVVGAHMTYLDSQHQEHVLNYRRMAEVCNLGE
ncbi:MULTISPECIES: DUF2790 domain-containing protein [unclassified Pseudomonas]|uniref:DUF2790 domain-containing protein n=1 Tax=unclassified Pseudomonas TaxID=196821 RepID=UPI0005B9FA82|nr:DUF2790 domain-containing protein [Pseudomonas sp. M47T1]